MSVSFLHPARSRRAARARPLVAVAEPPPPVTVGVLFVRYVRLRSVAAFAFIFCFGMTVIGVAALVVAWHVAVRAGLVADFEQLMLDLGFETFEVRAEVLLDGLLVLAAAGVLVGTALAVVAGVLFNLVNWVTGGIRLKVREQRRPSADLSGTTG